MRTGKDGIACAVVLAGTMSIIGCVTPSAQLGQPRVRAQQYTSAPPGGGFIPNDPSPRPSAAPRTESPIRPASATSPESPPPADFRIPGSETSAPAASPAGAATGSNIPANRDGLSEVRRLHQQAAARYARIESYIARLRRREQVNGKDRPEEVLLFKFRKEPWSLHMKWLDGEGKGREVVYVKGMHEGKIHTRLAAGDMPFAPAGKRIALAPDSILVRSASRHPITNAGIEPLIQLLGSAAARDPSSVRYLGPLQRPEFPGSREAVLITIPPGAEPALPQGGVRMLVFDPELHLPVLVSTKDHNGHEVEYYCYDRFQFPVRLDGADFDPEKLWADPVPQNGQSARR